MKKYLALMLTLCVFAISGCASEEQASDKIKIVTTIFPMYDWAKAIVGDEDDYEIVFLTDDGVDLHSYTPTVPDMMMINECDLFIFVGGTSDSWVEYTLANVTNENQVRLNLVDMIGDGILEKEIKNGMQIVEDECCDGDYDEHLWLSVKNAQLFTEEIKNAICELDTANAERYEENTLKYLSELEKIDTEFHEQILQTEEKTVVFGDRFPFLYLFKDYDIDYYAAFSSCTAETEASFQTIAYLVEKMNELELSNIFYVEGGMINIAQTIIDNTENKQQEILCMNSMEGVSMADVVAGESYLSIAKANLDALQIALKDIS
ncbi:MAG: metal ABC transporter substrate-binding protein [Clostridia bacterium]